MSKPIIGTIAAVLLAGLASFTSPAHSATNYPWCVQYGGGQNGIGATSCGFVSWAQCMETARGTGGMCVENPAYQEPRERAAKYHRKKKSH